MAPLHAHNPHYAVLDIKEKGHGLVNDGFDGIPVKTGEKYDFSVFARSTNNKRGKIIVRLLDEDGKVIGEARTGKISKTWNKLSAVVEATASTVNGRIEVIPNMEGKVDLDMVSLFPQKTFKNRKNGMRADLAQAIADIHPRFVRFPGGSCGPWQRVGQYIPLGKHHRPIGRPQTLVQPVGLPSNHGTRLL